MISIDSGLPYHQQDIELSCGGAVTQMMLASEQLGGSIVPQDGLLGDDGDQSCCAAADTIHWRTSPNHMCARLNEPPSALARFTACSDRSPEDACMRIANALAGTGLGVPAVVHGSEHWVAVSGMVIDDGTTGPAGAIKGFFVNDPEPAPPVVHNHEYHDRCGCGKQYGTANTYLTTAAWLSLYWYKPCRDFCPVGYVTVTRGIVPWPSRYVIVQPTRSTAYEQPIDAVFDGIRAHGLAHCGALRSFLDGLQPRSAGTPVPVFMLDSRGRVAPEPTYNIVPFVANGGVTANGYLEALTGDFMGIQVPAAQTFDFDQVNEFVLEVLGLSSTTSPLALELRPAAQTSFVWRSCRESMSPLYPFIPTVVPVDGGTQQRFIDMSGRAYDHLHRPYHA